MFNRRNLREVKEFSFIIAFTYFIYSILNIHLKQYVNKFEKKLFTRLIALDLTFET